MQSNDSAESSSQADSGESLKANESQDRGSNVGDVDSGRFNHLSKEDASSIERPLQNSSVPSLMPTPSPTTTIATTEAVPSPRQKRENSIMLVPIRGNEGPIFTSTKSDHLRRFPEPLEDDLLLSPEEESETEEVTRLKDAMNEAFDDLMRLMEDIYQYSSIRTQAASPNSHDEKPSQVNEFNFEDEYAEAYERNMKYLMELID